MLIAALRDGRKVVLAVERLSRVHGELGGAAPGSQGPGTAHAAAAHADGHLGIWGAVRTVFPAVAEHRGWNHRLVNVLDKLPQML